MHWNVVVNGTNICIQHKTLEKKMPALQKGSFHLEGQCKVAIAWQMVGLCWLCIARYQSPLYP
jgi:hypothetical protein